MKYLGIDPDTKKIGIAVASKNSVDYVGILKFPASYKGYRATEEKSVIAMSQFLADKLEAFITEAPMVQGIVIESQANFYGVKSTADPQKIIYLAQVAGALAMACGAALPGVPIWMPKPSSWKGTVSKPVHQKRMMDEWGWSYGVNKIPTVLDAEIHESIPDRDWTHVLDAIGLAKWGLSKSLPPLPIFRPQVSQ